MRSDWGRLFKRDGSRYWRLRYFIGMAADGKRRYRELSLKVEDEETAKRKAGKLQRDFERGELTTAKQRRLSFVDLETRLTQEYETSGRRSLRRLKLALKHLAKTFSGERLATITDARIVAYRHRRQNIEGAALASVNYELACFRHGLRLLKVPNAPTISLPVPDNARQHTVSDEDVIALCAELPEDLRAVVLVASVTGWRLRSELLRLTWDRVVDGWLRLDTGTTKSGKARAFPYAAHPALKAALEAQRERQRAAGHISPLVFTHDGAPIADKYFYRSWRRARKHAAVRRHENGLREVVRPALLHAIPHDLRRSAATSFRRLGTDAKTTMQLVGWSSFAMLQRYNISDEADALAAVAARAAGQSAGQLPSSDVSSAR